MNTPTPTSREERIELPGGFHFKMVNSYDQGHCLICPEGQSLWHVSKEFAQQFAAAMNAAASVAAPGVLEIVKNKGEIFDCFRSTTYQIEQFALAAKLTDAQRTRLREIADYGNDHLKRLENDYLAASQPPKSEWQDGYRAGLEAAEKAVKKLTDACAVNKVLYAQPHLLDAEDAIRALAIPASLPKQGEWQPIETAPKGDGDILLFRPTAYDWHKVSVGHWEDNKYAVKPRPYWTDARERILGVSYIRDNQPTHWMPLPAAPTAVMQEEGK